MTAGGVLAEADTVTRLEGLLAQALEANEQLTALVERQRVELAARDAELERVTAELVVLKRMLFGRSSERARPATADSSGDRGSGGGDGDGDGDTDGGGWPAGRGTSSKRGPGARAGRRDYSHLPRVEVVWVLSVAPVEGDGVLCVFGREDVFGARGSGWWAASG